MILLLLDFQWYKMSWWCPLLKDNLHKGWKLLAERHGAGSSMSQAASRGAMPAGSSSLVLLPPSSVGVQKPLRKCRPTHKPPWAPSTPAASCTAPVPELKLEVHGPPQPLVFWRRLSRKQSLSRCSIPCPSQSSRGAPVSFFLTGISATSSSTAFPSPSITLQPAFPSWGMGSREDFATHCILALLPGAQKDKEHLHG